MRFTRPFLQHVSRSLLLEFNPYQILAAEVSRRRRGAMVLESAAEFDRDDTAGLRRWIEGDVDGRKAWLPVICGLVPQRAIMQRQSLQPRRLAEPGYVAGLVEAQQKGRFLTATPFKILDPQAWTLRAVSALEGTALPPDGLARAALICGLANAEVHDVQQRLFDHRLMTERIEAGLLSLFGTVYGCMERIGDTRAVVIAVIQQTATAVYILGKEGVHTPNPVLHGFNSIVEIARKELGLKDEAEVRRQLQSGNHVLLNQAAKLVRRIGHDLKPVVDSYEMTTGQPVDEILCPYLPPNLAWIAEPVARATGRAAMLVDCNEWLPTAGLQVAAGVPAFGPHWLGALSLVRNLPERPISKSKGVAGEDPSYHRPWHVDCRLPSESTDHKFIGRRLLTRVIVAALAVFVGAITAWQLYANRTLRADTLFWERQMADNRQLFDELTAASARLKMQSGILQSAYDLMRAPYSLSDFILNLGRTIPPRMRIDRIETTDAQVAISGALFEPAEEASGTLSLYMDELRRNPAIGPLFSSIAITSLHRRADTGAVVFEITLWLDRSLL